MHKLQQNNIHRGLPIDLNDFRCLADQAKNDLLSLEAGMTTRFGISAQPMSPAESVLQSLGWDLLKFCKEFRVILEHMKNPKTAVTQKNSRLATRMGIRVIVMSGLVWNLQSKNMNRDYVNSAVAATLELAFLQSYREDLLKVDVCYGACELRKAFQDSFKPFLITQIGSLMSAGDLKGPRGKGKEGAKWTFADGIEVSFTSDQASSSAKPKAYDPTKQLQAVQSAHISPRKTKPDPATALIESLEKNKYLFCSKDSKGGPMIETSMHYHITALADVRSPHAHRIASHRIASHLISVSLTSLPSFQVVYKNYLRMEHEASRKRSKDKDANDDDDDFDMSDVELPAVSRKKHAISESHRDHVSPPPSLFRSPLSPALRSSFRLATSPSLALVRRLGRQHDGSGQSGEEVLRGSGSGTSLARRRSPRSTSRVTSDRHVP